MGGGGWEGGAGGSGEPGQGMCQTKLSRNIYQVHTLCSVVKGLSVIMFLMLTEG